MRHCFPKLVFWICRARASCNVSSIEHSPSKCLPASPLDWLAYGEPGQEKTGDLHSVAEQEKTGDLHSVVYDGKKTADTDMKLIQKNVGSRNGASLTFLLGSKITKILGLCFVPKTVNTENTVTKSVKIQPPVASKNVPWLATLARSSSLSSGSSNPRLKGDKTG